MRRFLTALIELACGLLFVLIAFLSIRVLLQSSTLVYFVFPLLCAPALLLGYWRGRVGTFPVVLTALLVAIPVAVMLYPYLGGRNNPIVLFPTAVLLFTALGGVLARRKAQARMAWISAIVIGGAAAFAGPLFVRLVVPARDVHEAAVPFTVHLVDGRTITSQQLRGQVVVLDFWATWCVPCQHELPMLDHLYRSMNARNDVTFLAVDSVMTDSPGDAGDTAELATAYFRRGGYTLPLAWDGGSALEKALNVHGFPTLILLDRTGTIRMRHVGFLGSENLEQTLSEKIEALHAEGR
jgi:thiol-disulfide isomerase/thioredoxin